MKDRERFSAATLAWLLIGPLILTGCAGPSQPSSREPLSATQALDEAEPTVDRWNAEAQLLIASAFEGSEENPTVQRRRSTGNGSFPVVADPLPGDGRAMQWVIVYLAANESRTLRVTSDQATWMAKQPRKAGPGARPIASFAIDSTEAVQRAANESITFSELQGAGDLGVFLTLGSGSRGPQWQIHAKSQSLNQATMLFVDAETGEVRNRSEMATRARVLRFDGNLTEAKPSTGHEAQIARHGARAAVQLSWNRSAAQQGVRMSAHLLDNGTEIEPAEQQQGTDRFQARWDEVPQGAYQVEVRGENLGNRSNVSYELAVHIG